MAIFVNSWPIGIAISLLVLPPIGVVYGASAVNIAVAALIAVGTGLLVVSLPGGLYWHGEIGRASWSSCGDCRGMCGIDLGAIQHRLCNGFQLWSLDAG
jgi:hypothetical protein